MRIVFAMVVVAALVAAGCSKDEPSSGPEDKDYVALGWSEFSSQRFDAAVSNFTEAYNRATTAVARGDALCGRGWAYAYKRELTKSRGDFVFAVGLTGVNIGTLNDLRAGAAMVSYSLNDFVGSITFASTVLTDAPSYLFPHDQKVTAKRLRLLLAQAYYANGQFPLAAAQMDLVDPARSPHSSDPAILLATITAALDSP